MHSDIVASLVLSFGVEFRKQFGSNFGERTGELLESLRRLDVAARIAEAAVIFILFQIIKSL